MKRPNTFKRYLKMIRPFDWIIVGVYRSVHSVSYFRHS